MQAGMYDVGGSSASKGF